MISLINFITENWISIIGSLMGLLYLYLEYKANVWMWAASIVMAAFYIVIFYTTQLYASMGIYLYFLLASAYGWFAWIVKGKNNDSGEYVILQIPHRNIIFVITSVCVAFMIIYVLLIKFSDSSGFIAIGDALTTALNVVALWMASRRWAEQWLLLIPANVISSILLFVQHDAMSCLLFIVFFIVSIFGYLRWKRLAQGLPA